MPETLQVTNIHQMHRRYSATSDSGRVPPSAPRTEAHSIDRRKSIADAREAEKQVKLAAKAKSKAKDKSGSPKGVEKAAKVIVPGGGKFRRRWQLLLDKANIVPSVSQAKGATRVDGHYDALEPDDNNDTAQIDDNNDVMQLDDNDAMQLNDNSEITAIDEDMETMQINDNNESNELNHIMNWDDVNDDDDDDDYFAHASDTEPLDSITEDSQETPTLLSDEGNDINDNTSDSSLEEGEIREKAERRRRSHAPEPED
jgi:hypothetical protein